MPNVQMTTAVDLQKQDSQHFMETKLPDFVDHDFSLMNFRNSMIW